MKPLVESWMKTYEMDNGKTLIIRFDTETTPATWHDPAEVEQSETRYYIDDEQVEYEELPDELDASILEELERNVYPDRG